jgi:chromosome segregation ATPase
MASEVEAKLEAAVARIAELEDAALKLEGAKVRIGVLEAELDSVVGELEDMEVQRDEALADKELAENDYQQLRSTIDSVAETKGKLEKEVREVSLGTGETIALSSHEKVGWKYMM